MKAAIWSNVSSTAKVVRIVKGETRSGLEKETAAILRETKQFNGYPRAVARLCGDAQQVGDIIAK